MFHMSIDDVIKVLEAITKLLSAVVWPALVLFVALRFGPSFKSFLESLGELSIKGGGLEATAKRKQTEIAANLAAAAAVQPSPGATPDSISRNARAVASLVADALTPRALRKAAKASILWVDDLPDNNISLQRSFETLGTRVVTATSTEEALRLLEKQHFDAIISDMGRPPDSQAGYTLLEQVRMSGNRVPFIIYSANGSEPQNRAEARLRGAFGSTDRSSEVFEYVVDALQTVV